MQFLHNKKLNRWETDATMMGRKIKLRFDRSFPEAKLVDIANSTVSKVQANTRRIQQNIVDSLLETYNDCWADPDDDALPEMDAQAFLFRIMLESVNVDDELGISLYFSDSDLFGGHTIDVLWLADDKMYDASLQG